LIVRHLSMVLMERSGPPEVSIVVPLYNEEDNVAPLCEAVREALRAWDREWELILVDDGSTDRTLELGSAEARHDRRVRMLRMRRNAGQTQAMAAGFARATGEIIVSMDGDLQNDPRDIPLVVSRIDCGYDVVCGWRKDRQDAWLSRTAHIITTQSGHPRAIPPDELADIIRKMTDVPVSSQQTAAEALNAALEMIDDDQLIIATGSVFEVASVRVAWMERQRWNHKLRSNIVDGK